MIPQFPTFKVLELSDKEEILNFTKNFEPYSDFNFTSLWTYNIKQNFEVSQIHNNLVVKMIDYNTFEPIFTFIGNIRVRDCFEEIFRYLKSIRKKQEIYLVPEDVINQDNVKEFFTCIEDPDNHDYILSVSEHNTLEGKAYHKRRNLVKRFIRDYENHSEIKIIDVSDPEELRTFQRIFNKWQQSRNKSEEDTDHEFIYIQRLFESAAHLDVEAIVLYINGIPSGFCVYEALPRKYSVIHFEKADVSYPGIFEYLTHITAKNLLNKGCEFINYEQDLGIPGLRNTKLLHRPSRFLRKFKVLPLYNNIDS